MAFHSYIVLFLLLLLLFPLNISCQNISLGQSLSPSTNPSPLISPSGDFAFGFRALETDPTLFLLAVYYYKINAKTVIWTANGATPVSNQSKAQLTSDGQLTLQDSPNQQIWSVNKSGLSYGSMHDNGNFVLYSGSSVIWQTFDHPTDTILPGQIINQDSTIYAKITDDDYSIGRFKLGMQPDGNLVMYAVGFPFPTTSQYDPYYATGTDGNTGNNRLVFNETGSLYLSFDNGTIVPLLPSPTLTGNNSLLSNEIGSFYLSFDNGSTVLVPSNPVVTGDKYLRATLDPDGGFRQYVFPKSQPSTGNWSIAANLVQDLCSKVLNLGSGICGFNSYCTQDASGLTNCTCPPHYTFIDSTKKYKGCKPDYSPQLCEQGSETSFYFATLKNLDWPLADAEMLSPMNETQCQNECLDDCFCLVAIHNNIETCWKKKFPLSNGKLKQDVDRVAFIKYNKLNISSNSSSNVSSDGSGNWKSWVIIVSSILICSVVSNLLQIGAGFYMCIKRKRERNSPKISSIVSVSAMCSFTYKELEQATKGFSEELGKGAFGVVYKGVLPSQSNKNNTLIVAVKKLEESLLEEGEQDFENEVATIGQTHHKNLVQLIGFCKEGSQRLIVFEFLSKGSLNKYIFGSNRPNWNQRVQIILGIANGLAYLHEECRNPIIHCDIKPQNILLDENMEARISDFGLAKLLRFDQTRTATGIRGTIGYFAPEWFKNIAISAKVDVYSFGVMLLQIICCKNNFGLESQDRTTVIDWAKNCYKNGRLDLLVEDDEEAKSDGIRLQRLVKVGISCVEDDPCLRPTMKKVVQMLEGTIGPSIIYGNSENYLSCK